MTTLHRGAARVFALLLDPFAAFPPMLGLALISALSGILLLLGFRVTSNPRRIRAARQQVQAHLLAVRLYRDDLAVTFRAQWSLLGALARYLGNMLVPFLVLLLPFALLFAQLDARYAARALHPGERTILRATVDPRASDGWRLEGTAGVVVDSAAVRIPARHEIDWRIRTVGVGRHAIAMVNGNQRVEKEVRVTAAPQGAAPARSVAGIAALFAAPA
ncbi:MAG TPA: hypothetical protein VN812_19900, partial [Candidatus Acidoferrales bacterium]|nr:hypothetical protein [Candidatus Acidoferrales bacterium]